MKENENKLAVVVRILFILYITILTWIILFKLQFSYRELPHIRNINLIPFQESVIINGMIDLDEIIENALIFFPLGIYVCMLFKKWRMLKKVAAIASVSLFYEVMQFILAIGATDITDVIMNTSGGILGVLFYSLCTRCLKQTQKVDSILTILCIIGTILFILLLAILLI